MTFIEVHSLQEVEAQIAAHGRVLLYFTSNDCGMCHALKPMVLRALEEAAPDAVAVTASINEVPALAGRFMAFSAPVMLLYDEGQERMREAGILDLGGLRDRFRRHLNV